MKIFILKNRIEVVLFVIVLFFFGFFFTINNPGKDTPELQVKDTAGNIGSEERSYTNTDSTSGDYEDSENNNSQNDTTNEVVLLCGDSMAGGLAIPFREFCKSHNYILVEDHWSSSTSIAWAATHYMQKLIEKYDPTFIILSLGSNELYTRDLTRLKVNAQIIKNDAGNKRFIWIGPPNWKEDYGYNNTVKDVLGSKEFFVSKYIPLERGADKKHPTLKGYYKWADYISDWIETESAYPIKIAAENNNK